MVWPRFRADLPPFAEWKIPGREPEEPPVIVIAR
jgi:hypothetical protein